MKREALHHTKMIRLRRRLDIPLYAAAGLLEVLWHTTAREAPRGDIGRLSDEDIAIAVDWRGDETKLVEALVSTGWLELNSEHRLIVHDWSEHADRSIHRRLARAKMTFADGKQPGGHLARMDGQNGEMDGHRSEVGGQTPTLAGTPARARPEPEPEPEPEPVLPSTTATFSGNGTAALRKAAPSSPNPKPRLRPVPNPNREAPAILLGRLDPRPDEAAVLRLWAECRQRDPAATVDEIAEAWSSRAGRLSPAIRNPIGVLITAVPDDFGPGGPVAQRRAAVKAAADRRAKAEAERMGDHESHRLLCEQILADEKADADDRLMAAWTLNPNGCATLAEYAARLREVGS